MRAAMADLPGAEMEKIRLQPFRLQEAPGECPDERAVKGGENE